MKIENLLNSLHGKSVSVQDVIAIGRRGVEVEGVNKRCISGAGFNYMNIPVSLETTKASAPKAEKLPILRTI